MESGYIQFSGEWIAEEASWSAEKGSFPMKRMGWEQLLELESRGNELAAHGYAHEAYDLMTPLPKLVQKMKIIKQMIEAKTGRPVFTMNYPYSHAPGNISQAARQATYLFGRTGLDTVNPPSPPNMYLLATRAILNENSPDTTAFRQWVDDARGNWLILMYHHLFGPDSKEMQLNQEMKVSATYSLPPSLFAWQMNEVRQSRCWIATLSHIGKYINERDRTTFKVRQGKRKIKIRTCTPLDPTLYDQPLTLVLSLPWAAGKIKGGLEDSAKEKNNGNFQVDFMPGATLIVYKKK